MRLNIKATNFNLTPELKKYVLEKIGSLERFFRNADPDLIVVNVELGRPSKHHRRGDVFRCEVNIAIGKRLLRAEELATSPGEAVDLVSEEIRREAQKFRTRRQDLFLRAARRIARRFKFFR